MSEFWYRTYRCEWVSEAYPVDQYDRRTKEPPIYESAFPTYDEAFEDLMAVTEIPNGSARRFFKDAKNSYHSTGVRYREVPVTPAIPST